MANYAVQSMSALPFGALIGGPLNAAIEAQATAALSTVNFIQAIGFTESGEGTSKTNEVRNVTFNYSSGGEQKALTVPILTIVPIPFIRIETMDIDFTAKMTESIVDRSSTNVGVSASASANWGFAKAKMSVSVSVNKSKESRYNTEMNMNIKVRAVQDEMPAGLARVLDFLEKTILESKPTDPTT